MLIGNDRYRLIETVGQGGMGRVWRARDEVLGREVAVKQLLIPPQLDDSTRRTLIQRATSEARAAARLRHAGIVTVHDIVEHEDTPWIVMDHISGPSLGTLIVAADRPDWRRVAAIGAEVADALAHAHAANVVHRDLKPDNILLAGDHPVITDFGIARLLDTTTQLTSTHSIVGTPQYMSPEQLQGQEVTGACDMWALGTTLFAVLEGRVPFDGPNLMSIITAVLTQPFPQPRNAGPLGEVLSALLEKDPARRPGAAAAAERLRALSRTAVTPPKPEFVCVLPAVPDPTPQHEPTPAGTPKPRSGLSRRALMFGGAGAAVAAVGGTAAAVLLSGSRAPQPTPTTSATSIGALGSYRGTVHMLSFSPDGKILIAGTDNHTVPLWDVATGAEIGTLVGHTDKVEVVAYSPDGKHIASSSDDGTIRIWNATTHVASATIVAGNGTAGVAFSPDGKTLATNAQGIALWDVATGTQIKSLRDGSNYGMITVAYSPDGKYLAEAYLSNTVGLWNATDYTELAVIAVDSSAFPGQVAFSPDSKTLAVANASQIVPSSPSPSSVSDYIDARAQIFDVATHALTANVLGFTDGVSSVAFSPDGAVLAASGIEDSTNYTVQLFDIAAKRTTRTLTSKTGAVNFVTYSPDGKLLAVASNAVQLVSM